MEAAKGAEEVMRRQVTLAVGLSHIEKFLKAGYVDNGMLVKTEVGTPQGSILSPILANIFLHYVLDEWFENVVKKHVQDFANWFVMLMTLYVLCSLLRRIGGLFLLLNYEDITNTMV
jgi:retron-type reverse transcriptase